MAFLRSNGFSSRFYDSKQFLAIEKLLCESACKWLKFRIAGEYLLAEGDYSYNRYVYRVKVVFSPLLPMRMERVYIERKGNDLVRSFETHFNGDNSLCLYHPIFDMGKSAYVPLWVIIPWIAEWIYYYDKFEKYRVWLGREHPHAA